MSLIPVPLDTYLLNRPSRLLDQHFGLGLDPEDFFQPILNRHHWNAPVGYVRPWRTLESIQDVGSTLDVDKDKFQVNLDVQQFKPEEISVKVIDNNTLKVEGKHEEQQDEHGYISRHFVRKYVLPKQYDINQVQSKLSSDGVLSITAPNNTANAIGHREIPVVKTKEPARHIEAKKTTSK